MIAEPPTTPVRNIFVVLDPTRLVQPSLDKAEWVAQRNQSDLHLYCCVWDTHLAFQRESQVAVVESTREWIERLAERPRRAGRKVVVAVEANPEWRDAIAAAAGASGCDLIVKTTSLHGPVTRRLLKTADWMLIQRCTMPILLANPLRPANTRTVLAAVKLKPGDDAHMTLNERVVELSQRIAGALEAELHAVTVYRGDEIYFDRQQFADSCKLPRNRVHAVEGTAHHGIAEIARRIDAGVVIVGCADRALETRSGETARLVIDEVPGVDIVVLPLS
jgi:nucleotide-binding universal stress UspA family protein